MYTSASFLGYSEGEYGSGSDPCRERHQTEESVSKLSEDERSGGCCSSKGPNCSLNEPGTFSNTLFCMM